MSRKLYHIPFLLFCFILSGNLLYAQLNADFSANVQQGCSPLIVSFTNQSSGNINDYFWRFGNNNTSDTITPSATYITPGEYSVTLIVYGSGGTVDSIVKDDFITVFANPEADFTASQTTGCLPATIDFTDLSIEGSGSINSWQWDFGDGASSTQQNPAHTYQSPGIYTVSLEVEDDNGCTHFFFIDDYIKITNPPVADFNTTDRIGCSGPYTVDFTNNSSGSAPLIYVWDFGDGSNSSQENPSHTYNTSGSFDVELIVTDASGCSDTLTQNDYVSVDEPVADFTVSSYYGCSDPPTFFQFNSQSTGPQGFIRWEFGDNSVAQQMQSPTHIYDDPGVYTVRLITGNANCKDTAIAQIYVQQLEADFDMDKRLACEPPLEVNFTDQSSNAVDWNWSFGDGSSSSQQNPSHTYTTEDSFFVQLSITDSLGCVSTHRDTAIVDIPELSIDTSIGNYCIPVDVQFSNLLSSVDPAQSYSWNFGTGGTSTAPNPVHTYTDTGQFLITLQVTTALGCEISDTIRIQTGDTATIFSAALVKDTICRQEGTPLNIVSDFAENFEGDMQGERPFVTIIDSFADASISPGDFYTPIRIKGIFHECKSRDFIFDDTLFLLGPYIEEINPQVNCSNTYEVQFFHSSYDYQELIWAFGDGDSSTQEFPTHTYASRGSYRVTLSLYDTITECRYTRDQAVQITEPIAIPQFSDTAGCGPLEVITNGLASQDAEYYNWQSDYPPLNIIGAGPDTFNIPPGEYYVRLLIEDVNECVDIAEREISVYGHETQINAFDTSGCVPVSLDVNPFVNADTSIATYSWNIAGTAFSDSAVSYQFNNSGVYSISLITTDFYGCSGQAFMQFTAADPSANFIPNKQIACIGEDVIFINTSNPNSGLDYNWNFGDGNTSQQPVPTHQYSYNDTFTVSLIVSDIYGCSDTIVKPDIVQTSSPVADFTVSDSSAPCPPLFVNFADLSTNDVTSWAWNFGDNSGSVLDSPGHSYNRPGSFDVELQVSNQVGCRDTLLIEDLINIGGPTGEFVIAPQEGCRPLTSQFNIVNANDVAQVTWDFGDGFSANGDTVSHTYTTSGTFYPNVVLLNSNNCSFSYERIDTIIVDTLIAAFTPSATAICTPANLTAFESSEGDVISWSWSIDDSISFTGQNFQSQVLTEPRNYDVQLVVENPRGCLDSVTKTISVNPLPFVEVSGDTFFCENDPGQLFATEDPDFSYQWLPATGLDDPNSASPTASLSNGEDFRVIVTDENGCIDTSDYHSVYVHPELELSLSPDTTIIMGDTAYLRPSVNQAVRNIEWTPDTDINCTDCFSPNAYPLDQTTYTISVQDTVGCDEKTAEIVVNIIDDIKIAMPEIFTPNQDDVNDLLFVKGWNIKELVYFRIYNRWGELVFETDDLNEGWDGTYKGEPQNMDSYAYVIKAISHKDREGEARGSFSLIR